ncbi:ethanolamine utilization protein EutH [Raoultibacter massiliensis]|uniref:ethanolamine utilization protein EutH n=1 Tax=Raoultibacter massiliensis TaxID=1852371 RepID=UPI003A90F17F
MEMLGTVVVYIVMICAIVGCAASVIKPESELGQQWQFGIEAIGSLFLSVAGVWASIPYLKAFISAVFGPAYAAIGADPALAATTFIASDMGGYQLAETLAQTYEGWIMAMTTGYMAGATIVFTIPVALKMIPKKDQKYLALGAMSGFLAIPIGVLVTSVILAFTNPFIRETAATNTEATYQLALTFSQIGINLVPLIIICVALALGLRFKPDAMIKGFMVFGRVLESALKIILVLCVVEYFTGFFSSTLGSAWGFDPILATEDDLMRCLEACGATGMMLCGAFPMVWLIRKFLAKPLEKLGNTVGLDSDAMTGILAASANLLALLAMFKTMKARDKVITLSFAVCCAFVLGDHLSFTANFQPTLIVPIMFGKLVAGICAIAFARWLSVKKAEELEAKDKLLEDKEAARKTVDPALETA